MILATQIALTTIYLALAAVNLCCIRSAIRCRTPHSKETIGASLLGFVCVAILIGSVWL